MYSDNTTLLEYLWIDGSSKRRSKTRIFNFNVRNLDDIPIWNYDGSSTGQADSNSNTEVILVPCKFFINPLINTNTIRGYSYIVLCETFDIDMKPLPSNHRHNALRIFNRGSCEEPWFGIEQEYDMIHTNSENESKCLSSDGRHYCGTQLNSIERKIAEEHLHACLNAKIKYGGLNSEVTKGQWEFQVGPCEGIEAGDHIIVANFLLERIAEKYDVKISYNPKLYPDKNGTGGHTNFSTSRTRSEEGIEEIYRCIKKLRYKHNEHIAVYGEGNDKRLTGLHETSSYTEFSLGVGTRNTSVRIPSQVAKEECGYFEDRRPAANCDFYQVTSIIFQTCCLEEI
jgi:glutamine synthetase